MGGTLKLVHVHLFMACINRFVHLCLIVIPYTNTIITYNCWLVSLLVQGQGTPKGLCWQKKWTVAPYLGLKYVVPTQQHATRELGILTPNENISTPQK